MKIDGRCSSTNLELKLKSIIWGQVSTQLSTIKVGFQAQVERRNAKRGEGSGCKSLRALLYVLIKI